VGKTKHFCFSSCLSCLHNSSSCCHRN